MMNTLEAIPTSYKGTQFKSRLEAQVAIFLDSLGYPFEYEAFSFMLPNGISYRPDFWIESIGLFIECRGDMDSDRSKSQLKSFTEMIEYGEVHRNIPGWDAKRYAPEFLVVPGDGPWVLHECNDRGGASGDAWLYICELCSTVNLLTPRGRMSCRWCGRLELVRTWYLSMAEYYQALTEKGSVLFKDEYGHTSDLSQLVRHRDLLVTKKSAGPASRPKYLKEVEEA